MQGVHRIQRSDAAAFVVTGAASDYVTAGNIRLERFPAPISKRRNNIQVRHDSGDLLAVTNVAVTIFPVSRYMRF